jgi:tRNA threonylcarbamoyladenosine biosynthesis protein TsaE
VQFPSEYSISDIYDLAPFCKELLHATACKIFLLEGDLGAGKTTFVQAFCKQLGVTDQVQSPTFSIINEYRTSGNERVVHMDLYRVKHIAELKDLCIDEYIESGDYCFIEWPELLYEYLCDKFISVYIEHAENNTRHIKLKQV